MLWNQFRNKYSGYAKYVGLIDEKVTTLAYETLVFLIVYLTEWFKCPEAYFLGNKLNSKVVAELINICISKLVDMNLRV